MAGALQASSNVTSVTDTGAGDWTVNWTTAFSTANYAIAVSAQKSIGTAVRFTHLSVATPPAAGSVRILSMDTNANLADADGDLFVIADGMGGYEGGEVASWLASGRFVEVLRAAETEIGETWEETCDFSRDLDPLLVAVVVYGHQPSASTQNMTAAGLVCPAI